MRHYLILTTVDVLARPNNREHHMLLHLAPRFEHTWVVYRRRCAKGGLRQVIFDALVPRASKVERDYVTFVAVNPLLNHFEGLASEAAGYQDFDGSAAALRRWLFNAISGLGIFKDISTIFFLAIFTWWRGPRHFEVATALGPWAAAAGLLLRALGVIDCLIYEDRDYEPGFIRTPLRRRWAAWLERFGMKRADRVITIGRRLADLRQQQIGHAVSLFPTGVELARFSCPERRELLPVLIYTGNMAWWSGLDLVLKALPAIRAVVPSVRCVFVGSGPPQFEEHLKRMVNALGLQDTVLLTGQVPYQQVQSYLAEAGIGLALFQPNELRRYAAPLKVLEYMAAGLPTIATSQSEAADLVIDEDCGVGVAFDVAAFSNAVVLILRDPNYYNYLAENARKAAEKYDWSIVMQSEYSLIGDTYSRRIANLEPAD
jgi:glycosyltransferase involved in cell wall biosynthesis